ncbi:hypothetical protein HII30_04590 [Paenibacillus lemnae]|uniref:DUF1440 domain-containing protein n=1 Tax=Paenibacillus lemnae TaxID=1330551 RepID=A0A848M639_PAELE|nr:hypothetical protein [Paenibacillus lemnae]
MPASKVHFTPLAVRSLWAGIIAGVLLGLFLKGVEYVTSLKVYTLLLNVDYIPLLNQLQLSEFAEFLLHLIISVLLALVLALIVNWKGTAWSIRTRLYFYMAVNTAVGLLLYPTTALSTRTPDLLDLPALLFWLTGHLLYGLLLGWMMRERIPR